MVVCHAALWLRPSFSLNSRGTYALCLRNSFVSSAWLCQQSSQKNYVNTEHMCLCHWVKSWAGVTVQHGKRPSFDIFARMVHLWWSIRRCFRYIIIKYVLPTQGWLQAVCGNHQETHKGCLFWTFRIEISFSSPSSIIDFKATSILSNVSRRCNINLIFCSKFGNPKYCHICVDHFLESRLSVNAGKIPELYVWENQKIY